MIGETRRRSGATLATVGAMLLGAMGAAVAGDEPGILGRLFRGGSGSNGARPSSERSPSPKRPQPPAPAVTPGAAPALLSPPTTPAATVSSAPATATGGSSASPRLRPQPRVNRAVTEADPILTRVALGRSDNGDQFGMFLQVYADGTVIDGEGARRASAEAMRPLLQALQAAELGRIEGHCGAPPTDYIEQVYVTVYERTKLGGLRANSFSFTGNPQGCDPAVRQLHAAIENLTAKLSSPAVTAAPAEAVTAPPLPVAPAPTLSLTPAN